MKPPSIVLGVAAAVLLALCAGCLTDSKTSLSAHPVISHLSPQQAVRIAIERAAKNGFATSQSDPWQLSFNVLDKPRWTALLYPTPGRRTVWIEIDDATGKAEFVAPEIHIEQHFADGSDWLEKIVSGLQQVKFPLELEKLMRTANLAGASCNGGGSTPDGRMYLECTLRVDLLLPARFEIRCYYREEGTGLVAKMVTAVELAYIDGRTNRYLLLPAGGT